MSVASQVTPTTQEHCIHKLPTSCRLTATHNCCACADTRSHTSAYPVYVDGIGIVNRGARWERYCWCCKDFWTARVTASNPPLSSSQTRIPDFPDQSRFLQDWYDLQRGYRVVRNQLGEEERVPLQGSLEGLSPGHLPAPFDDLPTTVASTISPSTEPELDWSASRDSEALLRSPASLTNSEVSLTPEERHRQVELQTRRLDLLRSELGYIRGALRRVVSDLQELGPSMETSPPPVSSTIDHTNGPLAGPSSPPSQHNLQNSADGLQMQLSQLRQRREGFNPPNTSRVGAENQTPAPRIPDLDLIQEYQERHREFENAHRYLHRLRSEDHAGLNMLNTFGSREEVERLGENYQNPVGAMFQSAFANYHRVEAQRRAQQTPPGHPTRSNPYGATRPSERGTGEPETAQSPGRDAFTPATPIQRPSLFGPPPETGHPSSGYQPTYNPPSSVPSFQHMHSLPYLHGVPPYVGLPPMASQYGANYGPSPSSTRSPGASNMATSNNDFTPTNPIYDRGNRPYVPPEPPVPYPPPPESQRIFPTRGAFSYRIDRRNRHVDPEPFSYNYDLVDEMDYEESVRDHPRATAANAVRGLDSGSDGRPEAKNDEDLKVSLECKVCLSQLVDTVLLPCGHAIMCQWCADQHVPCHKLDKTRPIGVFKCPMCRKAIKQKVRMYRG